MSVYSPSQRNVAFSVLIALQTAESHLMPKGGYSRLWVAVQVAEGTVSYLTYPSKTTRSGLVEKLELLREMESREAFIDARRPEGSPRRMHPDSLISRGWAVATYIAQTALADIEWPPAPVLSEAQQILRLAEQVNP